MDLLFYGHVLFLVVFVESEVDMIQLKDGNIHIQIHHLQFQGFLYSLPFRKWTAKRTGQCSSSTVLLNWTWMSWFQYLVHVEDGNRTWIGVITQDQILCSRNVNLICRDGGEYLGPPSSVQFIQSPPLHPTYEAIRMQGTRTSCGSGPWIHMSWICITYSRPRVFNCENMKSHPLVQCRRTLCPRNQTEARPTLVVWLGQVWWTQRRI